MADDDEDYNFAYSDAEEEAPPDDVAVQVENLYYKAKQERDEAAFRDVLALEVAHPAAAGMAEWGFKATKQLVKLSFRTAAYVKMLEHYK